MLLAQPSLLKLGARAAPAATQFACGTRFLHWPATPNPSPYQIFGLESRLKVDKKQLRAIYFELVKLYHPDRGSTGNAERFNKVVEAHNILKDDARRRSYDLTQAMSPSSTSAPTYSRQARPFEDDIDYNYWSNRNQAEFKEGLYANRIWVLKLVCTITVTLAVINFLLLKQASEARNEALELETERAAAQLAASSGNYGRGSDAQQRIERFLQHRQIMLDRFNNKFSWEQFKAGGGGAHTDAMQTARESESNDEVEAHAAADPRMPPAPRTQTKRHTGPVAEYFGRN